jgi:CRISPR/Cas system CSM-associated protein Csm3 (group 7 of RAMP superfamily)
MPLILTYTLTFHGDFHIGSGLGLPGLIDEFVTRDAQGFAGVPASHLKGLVCDSAYRLLAARGQANALCGGQRTWHTQPAAAVPPQTYCAFSSQSVCPLCTLFGSPSSPGQARFAPARYAAAYRTLLKGFDQQHADATTRAQAAIDPYTRRAQEHQLFNLEVVRPAETFEGTIELPTDQHLGLLTAAVLFTRRLGGRRRRGWGQCQFALPSTQTNNSEALRALDAWLPMQPPVEA